MTAAASLLVETSKSQACLDLFDAAIIVDADISLWEHNTSGAIDALTAWAELHGHPIQTTPVAGDCTVHRCAPRGDCHADISVYVRSCP